MNATPRHEILVIDSSVADRDVLLQGLDAPMEVILLQGDDGLEQLAHTLAGRNGIAALHLITHGAPGQLHLGAQRFTRADFSAYADALDTISNALAEDGELLIYGCEVAAGREGRLFIDALSATTGLKVAAATHKVGAAALGGDWVLNVGLPATQTLQVAGWGHVLVGDTTPPAFVSMTASGSTITLLFNEPLAPTNVPTPDMFTVKVNGQTVNLADIDPTAISGSSVILNLASSLDTGAAVSVVYAEPADLAAQPVMFKDLAGNYANYFSTVPTFTFDIDTTNEGESDYTETQAGVTLRVAGAYWGSNNDQGGTITTDMMTDGNTFYVFSQAIDISSIDWMYGTANAEVTIVDQTPGSTKTQTFTLTDADRQTLTLTDWEGVTAFKITGGTAPWEGAVPGMLDQIDNIVFAVSPVVSNQKPVINGITAADNQSFAAGTYVYLDGEEGTNYAYITDADNAHLNGGYLSVAYEGS